MSRSVRTLRMTAAITIIVAAWTSASAQTAAWVGGAIQRDTQRFDPDPEADRLDGAANGWTVIGGVRAWTRFAIRGEWAEGGAVDDVRDFPLDLGGRTITIHSTRAHRTRAFLAVGGYTHALSSRAQLAYLAGVAFTRVERTFTTNAPGPILGPSAPSPTSSSTEVDRFAALAGGVDGIVRIRARLHVLAGVRAQTLRLNPPITGWSVRWFTGGAWMF